MKSKRFIPWGRTLTTKDNFLGKQKTKSCKTRPVVVVDTNNEDLAVVPLSSKKSTNRTEKGYKNPKTKQKTYYKHYLEIEDNEGHPIRVNEKFRENHKNMDVSREQVLDIRQKILTQARTKD